MRYMAEITDFEKQDVLNWWSKKDFDLQIPEHLGNCVFSFKKNINKIALATRDEPELLEDWKESVELANDRLNKPVLKFEVDKLSDTGIRFWVQHIKKGVMYRGMRSIDDVIAMFPQNDDDYIRELVYRGSKDSGGCSESCEAFVCQPELI